MRPTWLEVDLGRLGENYRTLARRLAPKTRVIGVVKANAYGHGAVPVAKRLLELGAARLAVATAGEGAELRRAGIEAPIHLLGSLHPDEAEDALKADLIPTLATLEAARALAALRPGATVHVKVDTGMGRVGVPPDALADFLVELEGLGLFIEGILTHFAVADEDPAFTRAQLARFLEAVRPLKKRYLLHAANSAAILAGIGTDLDFVRPGIALYGLPPDQSLTNELSPILSWKAKATLVKTLPAGHGVGYGLTWKARGGETLATLPFGYADGFPRALSNRGFVRLGREYLPVVGRVSMDQTTVLLKAPPPPDAVFEVVTADFDPRTSLTGRARALGTIHYELATALNVRLPRRYTR